MGKYVGLTEGFLVGCKVGIRVGRLVVVGDAEYVGAGTGVGAELASEGTDDG